jgi:hypothetical protein
MTELQRVEAEGTRLSIGGQTLVMSGTSDDAFNFDPDKTRLLGIGLKSVITLGYDLSAESWIVDVFALNSAVEATKNGGWWTRFFESEIDATQTAEALDANKLTPRALELLGFKLFEMI